MSGTYRGISWRQGDVVRLRNDDSTAPLCIIATHDCDICADIDVEPLVEYFPLELTEKLDGSAAYGRNPRKLHLPLDRADTSTLTSALDIRHRKELPKAEFFQRASLFDAQPAARERVVLRRWLAARYARSAFADSFETLMRRVDSKIDVLSKKKGEEIRALYFDLDDNESVERNAEGDIYALAIYVVYPPDTNDEVAAEFARKVSEIFQAAFFDPTSDAWYGIQLLSCDAICEDSFPLSMALSTKSWRVDHRSYESPDGDDLRPDSGS